jgi:hypothetical protein
MNETSKRDVELTIPESSLDTLLFLLPVYLFLFPFFRSLIFLSPERGGSFRVAIIGPTRDGGGLVGSESRMPGK